MPGAPIWIDAVPIWDGDEAGFTRLVDKPSSCRAKTLTASGPAARGASGNVVVGVDERGPHGTTI